MKVANPIRMPAEHDVARVAAVVPNEGKSIAAVVSAKYPLKPQRTHCYKECLEPACVQVLTSDRPVTG